MTMRKGMLVLVVLVCVVLGGCQLAREDGEGSSKTMVGVLLTTGARPTFAEENGQEPRLYAQVSEDYDVTFPETEGYLMAVARFTNAQGEGVNVTACDEDISMSELHIASGDVERVSFTGTLYVNTSKLTAQGQEVVYVNPVYQDGEGRIWAEPGAGIALSPDVEGGMWTNTYTSTHTEQAGEESQTYESAVTVKIAPRYPPLQTVVHEMSGDNQVLCTQAYEPGALDGYQPSAVCAYLVVEEHRQGPEGVVMERMLIERGTERMRACSLGQGVAVRVSDVGIEW